VKVCEGPYETCVARPETAARLPRPSQPDAPQSAGGLPGNTAFLLAGSKEALGARLHLRVVAEDLGRVVVRIPRGEFCPKKRLRVDREAAPLLRVANAK